MVGNDWKQLRSPDEPPADFNTSLLDVLQPLETVESLYFSTYEMALTYIFGGSRDPNNSSAVHEEGLLELLQRHCPRLRQVVIVSDWRHTNVHNKTENPYMMQSDFGDVSITVLFPKILDSTEPGAQRRVHGIQHTKLCMVHHTTVHLRIASEPCEARTRNVGGRSSH